MRNEDIGRVISLLKKDLSTSELPPVTKMAEEGSSPFQILIAAVLSARTTDPVSAAAVERLFSRASTPGECLILTEMEIAGLIYPVGFYRVKAANILSICRDLVNKYGSKVPDTIEELLTFRGVGRKSANLVVSLAFGGPGICVDIHVHRISNRLGYVQTRTPGETEKALRAKLHRRYWHIFNTLLVGHGQKTCRPISPFCSRCPVFAYCDRAGVKLTR